MEVKQAAFVFSEWAPSPLEESPFLPLEIVGSPSFGGRILPERDEPATEDYVLCRTRCTTGGRQVFT